MTTVDALQAQLDLHPDDHDLRMVLADALEEEGSALAAGYRAIGIHKRMATRWNADGSVWVWFNRDKLGVQSGSNGTTSDEVIAEWWQGLNNPSARVVYSGYYHTRRDADDDLALAFSKLPADSQRELLEGKTP